MRVLVVDDERKARETIAQIIHLYFPDGITIDEASAIDEAEQKINTDNPDLILLDIRLKEGTGFDLIERVKRDDLNIIFITAYEEYAIKACKLSALDYLLKPVDPEELKDAIQKAQKRVHKDKMLERLDAFVQNMSGSIPEIKKITLKTSDSIYIISTSDIVFL